MGSLFIVVDGMDGSGKTELVKRLHNYLFSKDKRFKILTTREPSNGIYGARIREMLANEHDPMQNAEKLLDLFVKDRKDHLETTIIPFLSKNSGSFNIVICDRYYYSTLAFQQTQGIPLDRILEKNRGFRKPDIAFILDIEPKAALERIQSRAKEKFENEKFMHALRKNFLGLKTFLDDRVEILDAGKRQEDVFLDAKRKVDEILDAA